MPRWQYLVGSGSAAGHAIGFIPLFGRLRVLAFAVPGKRAESVESATCRNVA